MGRPPAWVEDAKPIGVRALKNEADAVRREMVLAALNLRWHVGVLSDRREHRYPC